jgi:hypothetical protein
MKEIQALLVTVLGVTCFFACTSSVQAASARPSVATMTVATSTEKDAEWEAIFTDIPFTQTPDTKQPHGYVYKAAVEGWCLWKGIGVGVDLYQASMCFKLANSLWFGETGRFYAPAEFCLGEMYARASAEASLKGKLDRVVEHLAKQISTDDELAVHYYLMAAQEGHALAVLRLGDWFKRRLMTIPSDAFEMAIYWMRAAARLSEGHTFAEHKAA